MIRFIFFKLITTMSIFFSLLLRFFFFFFTSKAYELDINLEKNLNLNYTSCPSYNCGNLLIKYPFWRVDDTTTTQFCGYHGFGIDCSHGGRATIRLPGDSYYVKDINYKHQNLTLVDQDAAPGECPRVRRKIDLVDIPLNFSSLNANLSFHFNCTAVPDFATVIPCLASGHNLSFVNILGNETEDLDWDTYNCDDEVVTTVMEMSVNRRDRLAAEFSDALRGGFELNWQNVENCGSCEESGGRCGYKYLKWNRWEVMCFCSNGKNTTDYCQNSTTTNFQVRIIAGVVGAGITISLISCMLCCMFFDFQITVCTDDSVMKSRTKDDKNIEAFIMDFGSLTPKMYTYSEIEKITWSLRVKLGQGGFGSVFKGRLSDGRHVAVKVLNSSKGNGEEFFNEVASIGRTSHVNIVTLLGFCCEGEGRALIYDFMPNGSLEKFIQRDIPLKTDQRLGVNKLYEIALGIARGLEYLHCGCNTRILHLDIKPHNILLDKDFCPKIADFGLAKLYSRTESIISMLEARGTIGYIAPEVFLRNIGRVSHKSDVYSYGMMLLEMVGGRSTANAGVDQSSEIYFPNWIYKRLEEEDLKLEGLETGEENEFARKMILVGLWCIQTNPSQRPSMSKVIDLLEGSTEAIQVPPKPFLSSPPRLPETTSPTSDSETM